MIISTGEGVEGEGGNSDSGLHFSFVESPLGKEGGWVLRSPRGLQFFLCCLAEVKQFLAILPGFSFYDQHFPFTQRCLCIKADTRSRSSSIHNIRLEAKVGDGSEFCWTRESLPVRHNLCLAAC